MKSKDKLPMFPKKIIWRLISVITALVSPGAFLWLLEITKEWK